jgi:hypothetical protein
VYRRQRPRTDLLRRLDDGLRRGGNPAGGFEQRLCDLPTAMERGGRSVGGQQQPARLQRSSRRHALGYVGAGHGHDPAGFLAAGRDHRLASLEANAAAAVAKSKRVRRQVAIRHVLGQPLPQLVVGDRQHIDRSGAL